MKLTEKIWQYIALFLAQPRVARWLIERSMRTPYLHIPSNENPSYMERYWLFNPYNRETGEPKRRWIPFSIRIHFIKRADLELHPHDHPWNARTIILDGWYHEVRIEQDRAFPYEVHNWRVPGATATIGFEKYHRITHVKRGGCYTLFISWRYQGVWGFKVGDHKIPWRAYLAGARSPDDVNK